MSVDGRGCRVPHDVGLLNSALERVDVLVEPRVVPVLRDALLARTRCAKAHYH